MLQSVRYLLRSFKDTLFLESLVFILKFSKLLLYLLEVIMRPLKLLIVLSLGDIDVFVIANHVVNSGLIIFIQPKI